MNRPPWFKQTFWLVVALLLIIFPNFCLLAYEFESKTLQTAFKDAVCIMLSALLVLTPPALFKIRMQRYFKIYLPFVLVAPVSAGLVGLLGQNVTEGHFLAILNTNINEAREFLGGVSLFLPLAGVATTALFYRWTLLQAGHFQLYGSIRFSILMLLFGLAASLYVLDTTVAGYSARKALSRMGVRITQTYPLGTSRNLLAAVIKHREIKHRTQHLRHFRFNAEKRVTLKEREIYVVVIGESGRFSNWGLNGYHRNTSPRLSARRDILSFSKMSAGALITQSALPLMLTRATPTDFSRSLNEKSLTAAFSESGFKTYWLANQDIYGTCLESFALEADVFLSVFGAYHVDGKYDENLLPKLSEIIGKKEPKIFIILHTLGSHFNYAYRYPRRFDKFQPSRKGLKASAFGDPTLKKELINAYDNSILYTDMIIAEIIRIVKDAAAVSAVIYTSDHGEILGESANAAFGHGISESSAGGLHVPLFLWMSPAYKRAYPGKHQSCLLNLHSRISSDNFFYSCLDIAGISVSSFDSSASVCSQSFLQKPRYFLDSRGGIVNLQIYEGNPGWAPLF